MKKRLEVNEAYIPYLKDEHGIQIFFGGSSSGKSFFLSQRTVMDVIAGRNYLIVRNVAATIRYSCFNQINKTIADMGLKPLFKINQSDMVITCRTNGRQILFAGLDDVEKLKSLTPAEDVLTDIWIEEATEVAYEDYKQLDKRLRGITEGGFKKRITFSFNPVLKTHWIHKEFFGNWDDTKRSYADTKICILKSTYKDNAYLAEDDIRKLEDETDRYFYEVYTLGNWGVLGKVIFKNWHTEDLSALIPTFSNIYNGMDFGFSDDPNALIRLHVDTTRRKIYAFEEMYKCGMTDIQLAQEVKERIGNQYVTCDSADSKTIYYLNTQGIRALAAVKGADSINYGIRFLQGYEIIVDVKCQNLKNELQTYQWKTDKYGNTMEQPVDKDNHLIDAMRYATESIQLQQTASATRRMR